MENNQFVSISPQAGRALRKMLQEKKYAGASALRFGLAETEAEAGNRRPKVMLGFEANPARDNDTSYECEGIEILIDSESLPHVQGICLDVRVRAEGIQFFFLEPETGEKGSQSL